MSEFFITARSFAAPFVSDESEAYQEGESAKHALERFAADYKHPFGLYAAEAWENADAYHKHPTKPLARWLSNHEQAKREATQGKGSYGYRGHRPGRFEIDDELITIENPKGGSVVVR